MKNMKPVWRMNAGRGVPDDVLKRPKVLFFNGALSSGATVASDWNWLFLKGRMSIYAYQTNRTKEAKYR